MNNIIEHDHRFNKRKVKSMLGFDRFILIGTLLSSCTTVHKNTVTDANIILSQVMEIILASSNRPNMFFFNIDTLN